MAKETRAPGAGRPREHEPFEKTTVSLPPIMMGKLRMMCLQEGWQMREVMAQALNTYLTKYEKEHGEIPVPQRYLGNDG
jgi:hypothetical protein